MHPAMSQLAKLPVAERLELVQELWDSIAEARDQTSSQDWHRELAKSRLVELKGREEAVGLTRQQVWDRVDQRRGS